MLCDICNIIFSEDTRLVYHPQVSGHIRVYHAAAHEYCHCDRLYGKGGQFHGKQAHGLGDHYPMVPSFYPMDRADAESPVCFYSRYFLYDQAGQ